MKKGCLIGLAFLGCSIVIIWLMLIMDFRYKTVLEQDIDDSYTMRIQAEKYWEICVSVHLEIESKNGETLTSAPFSCYPPEDIESKTLRLEIRKMGNIVFIYKKGSPNKILTMVDLEDDLVYPGILRGGPEEIDLYYSRVRELFSKLKMLLNNDELKLSGLFREK